jgi:hypothetical protein
MFAHTSHSVAREQFQLTNRKIFLAELDVVHAKASGFRYPQKKLASLRLFVAHELMAVGDVVEKQQKLF